MTVLPTFCNLDGRGPNRPPDKVLFAGPIGLSELSKKERQNVYPLGAIVRKMYVIYL